MKRIRGFGGRSYGKRNPLKEMEKLQEELQKKMEEVKRRYSEEKVEVSVGGGAMRIVMSCDYRVEDVGFDEDLLEDVEMFKDMLIAGFNEALERVEERREEIASETMGGFGIPGMGIT